MKKIALVLISMLLLMACGGENETSINSTTGRFTIGTNNYASPNGNFNVAVWARGQGYLGGVTHRYHIYFKIESPSNNPISLTGRGFTLYAIQSNKPPVDICHGSIPSWGSLSGRTVWIPSTLLTKKGYSWSNKLLVYANISGFTNRLSGPGTYNGYGIFEIDLLSVKPEPALLYEGSEVSKNQIIDAGTITTNKTFEFTLTNKGSYGYNLLGDPAVSITGANDMSVIQQPGITNIPYCGEGPQVKFRLRVNPTGDTLKTAVIQMPLGVDFANTPNTFSIKYRTGELPSISISPIAGSPILTNNITISGTASDATSGVQKVEWKLDNGTWQTATGTTSWNFNIETRDYEDGLHNIYVRATDNAGNTTTATPISLTFSNSKFTTAQIVKQGDFNNDGKTDFVVIPNGNAIYTYLSQTGGSYTMVKYSPSPDYQTIGTGKWMVGDFNGDGKADLVHIVCSGVATANYMHPWISNGDGTYNVLRHEPSPTYNNASGEWKTGDFNGDGKTDLVHLVNDNYIHIHFGLASGLFQPPTQFFPAGVNGGYQVIGAGKWLTGDFNGDGKTDLVHVVTVGPKNYMHPWYSTGTGTFGLDKYEYTGYDTSTGDWLSGDFNGDGVSDLIHLTGANYTRIFFGNTSKSKFVLSNSFYPPSGYALHNTGYWRTGDFNGDNKTDLLHIGTVNAADYVYTWLSDGNAAGSFNVVQHQHVTYTTTDGAWGIGKINSDNQDDLMHIPHGRYCHPWISGGNGSYSIQKWYY